MITQIRKPLTHCKPGGLEEEGNTSSAYAGSMALHGHQYRFLKKIFFRDLFPKRRDFYSKPDYIIVSAAYVKMKNIKGNFNLINLKFNLL